MRNVGFDFLIGFLIGMEDKKRRWALGGVFIGFSRSVLCFYGRLVKFTFVFRCNYLG